VSECLRQAPAWDELQKRHSLDGANAVHGQDVGRRGVATGAERERRRYRNARNVAATETRRQSAKIDDLENLASVAHVAGSLPTAGERNSRGRVTRAVQRHGSRGTVQNTEGPP
jgi:hypothetical protein